MADSGRLAIFVSPHLDDIALSCGGMAARLAREGVRCISLVLFAGPAPEGTPLSSFAQGLHAQWERDSGQAVKEINGVRREEERQASRLLGLEPVWLDLPDAPYRFGASGQHFYNSDDELMGSAARVAPEERRALVPVVAEHIRRVAHEAGARGRVRVFAPLAVGCHVDHQITFLAARSLPPRFATLFYEDFPYASWDNMLEERLSDFGFWILDFGAFGENRTPIQNPKSKIQNRLAPIDDLIGLKIAAISRYKSQLGVLFKGSENVAAAVRGYFSAVAEGLPGSDYAERFWLLPAVYRLA